MRWGPCTPCLLVSFSAGWDSWFRLVRASSLTPSSVLDLLFMLWPSSDFSVFQVVPQCPGAPPTWYPGSSFHPSCQSSPLWSSQWLETPVSVSLSSICEFEIWKTERLWPSQSPRSWQLQEAKPVGAGLGEVGTRLRRGRKDQIMGPGIVAFLCAPSSQQRFRARCLQPLFPRAAWPGPPPSSSAASSSSGKELRTVEETNPAG